MSDAPPQAKPQAMPRAHELAVVADVAGEFAERVVEAFHCRSGERFGLALTGGPVAAECYERLATHGETQIDWWQVELFMADECQVDVDHVDCHERLVRVMLLDRVGAAHLVYPLRDDASIATAGAALAERPLDLVHLVLGSDGRLSSVFPSTEASDEAVIRTFDPHGVVPHQRLSLSPLTLSRAGCVLITAVGSSVAEAFRAVRDGADVPGNRLGAERVVWLADRAAAGV